MGDLENQEKMVDGEGEKERLLEGMSVLDFDVLCSTVAMQTQGKWTKFDDDDDDFEDVEINAAGAGAGAGGVFRMWEGELFDCFDERRIAIESTCCPWYRFGKNMRRAGFGACFLQATAYIILVAGAILSVIAFGVTGRHIFLYLAVALTVSLGMYLGYFRTQMRKKFNIKGSDSSFDDCVYHLICPCCTLCQESRTLEMNNVQDGTWHGRGDTICVGTSGEGSKTFFELHPPPIITVNSPSYSCRVETKGSDNT